MDHLTFEGVRGGGGGGVERFGTGMLFLKPLSCTVISFRDEFMNNTFLFV